MLNLSEKFTHYNNICMKFQYTICIPWCDDAKKKKKEKKETQIYKKPQIQLDFSNPLVNGK